MKKIILVLFTVLMSCVLITGCSLVFIDSKEEYTAVYSFSGSNEQFAISNGSILLSDTESVFRGGNFEEKSDTFRDIVSYSMTFYIISGEEKVVILSNVVEDLTGQPVHLSGEIGTITVEDIPPKFFTSNPQNWKNNLCFELKTIDSNQKETVYQLSLSVAEITDKNQH